MEWLVTAAAGLSSDKGQKLNMTMGLTDKQMSNIEEVRKFIGALGNLSFMRSILSSPIYCLGTDLAWSNGENLILSARLLSMKKEMTNMGKRLRKVAKYVDSMEKRISTLQKELDAILSPAKTSSDDKTTSQRYDLVDLQAQESLRRPSKKKPKKTPLPVIVDFDDSDSTE